VSAKNVVIAACAASAGAHAALVPEHLREEPRLGVAFILATVALAVLAIALTLNADRYAVPATALLMAALIGAYVLAVTDGIPWLSPEPEGVDAVALATKAVEALGLIFAVATTNKEARS
jgi:peptidoglycan/LPS O-acetylase OafA/YrhL